MLVWENTTSALLARTILASSAARRVPDHKPPTRWAFFGKLALTRTRDPIQPTRLSNRPMRWAIFLKTGRFVSRPTGPVSCLPTPLYSTILSRLILCIICYDSVICYETKPGFGWGRFRSVLKMLSLLHSPVNWGGRSKYIYHCASQLFLQYLLKIWMLSCTIFCSYW